MPSLLPMGTTSAFKPRFLALLTNLCQFRSPFSFTIGSHLIWSRCQTMTFCGLNELFSTALCISDWYSIGALPPSMPQEDVMIALGLDASNLCASDGGEKPPNTTAWMAPMRFIASIAKRAAGIIGTACTVSFLAMFLIIAMDLLYIITTSPLLTPSSLNTPARISTSLKTCLYVYFSLLSLTGLSQ
jgi:hypothetical protein